jgi:hypothetical protein
MMKKNFFYLFLGLILSSFVIHKFYVSIYQMNYNADKKRIEITSRMFLDDLNTVLQKNHKKEFTFGSNKESDADVAILKQYIKKHLVVSVNGVRKDIVFISKEIDGHELVCYMKINEIEKIKTLDIQNNSFFELNDEQQNIIQFKSKGKKQNLVLTKKQSKGSIKL